ncbi:hypothetical protein BCR34DRAFT_334339 [Clohesyomyces aquaticus]|uniref:Uncharacterized protein n=1 Tax=Clohesyomyces aquaticus TaxID=1231657 RepID=A0A1Y1ZLD5_9PLEO|nr:hypothetical protein BCR34DRAFT_334339 [Clohesyomyces aquaticus]
MQRTQTPTPGPPHPGPGAKKSTNSYLASCSVDTNCLQHHATSDMMLIIARSERTCVVDLSGDRLSASVAARRRDSPWLLDGPSCPCAGHTYCRYIRLTCRYYPAPRRTTASRPSGVCGQAFGSAGGNMRATCSHRIQRGEVRLYLGLREASSGVKSASRILCPWSVLGEAREFA